MNSVPDTLRAYNATTLVVRAADALVTVVPGLSAAAPYHSVADVVSALSKGTSPDSALLSATESLCIDATSNAIVAIGAAVDGADRALARSLQHPPQIDDPHTAQARDATLKGLALAAIARKLSGGGPLDPTACVAAFLALPSGRLAMGLWAAVDVVLPLGGTDVAGMVSLHQVTEASRLAVVGGESALDGAVAVWTALAPKIQPLVDSAAPHTEAITRALAPFVPGLISRPEGAAERVAVQSDRMPIYKWLAARLAAEHAFARAAGISKT